MILNWLQRKFGAKSVTTWMKCCIWKPCSDLHWLDKLWYLIFFLAICTEKFSENCVADQLFITQCLRYVLNFKFSVLNFLIPNSEVNGLLDEHWAKKCGKRIFQLHSMSNVIIKICSQKFWYILFGLDIMIFNLNNLRMTIQHFKNWFKAARYYKSFAVFFSRSIYGWVSKVTVTQWGTVGNVAWVWFPQGGSGCWNSLMPLGHFVWHRACLWTDWQKLCSCSVQHALSM